MVDMVYYLISLALVCLCFLYIGWDIGYHEAKRKYNKKTVLKRFVLPKDAVIKPVDENWGFVEEVE
jgi:hypothetical protein